MCLAAFLGYIEREREREREGERERQRNDGLTGKKRKEKNNHKKLQRQGRDHTLFALVPGRVSFEWDHRTKRRSVRIVEEGS